MKFVLINCAMDMRPKGFNGFGVIELQKHSQKSNQDQRSTVLLFGCETNKGRYTYIFDDQKKELQRADIYTGDEDRFLGNEIAFDKS